MCTGMRIDMCSDMCIDVSTDMCAGARTGMCTDMRIDICTDMRAHLDEHSRYRTTQPDDRCPLRRNAELHRERRHQRILPRSCGQPSIRCPFPKPEGSKHGSTWRAKPKKTPQPPVHRHVYRSAYRHVYAPGCTRTAVVGFLSRACPYISLYACLYTHIYTPDDAQTSRNQPMRSGSPLQHMLDG